MNDNCTIPLVAIPIGGKEGVIWNRLHGEREDICEALLRDPGPASGSLSKEHERCGLQARLRKIDAALDRLMSESYGCCSKCGRSIDDTRLDMDPALVLCVDCCHEPSPATSSSDVILELKRIRYDRAANAQ